MFDHDAALERELREGFSLLDPPEAHRQEAVVVAWRLTREAAVQRGLFTHPSDRLLDLSRLSPDPWTTPFGYLRPPDLTALKESLDQEPQVLLPALADTTYFDCLARPIQLLSTPSGRVGACHLRELRVTAEEVLNCEEQLTTKFARDADAEGLDEARRRARFSHGFSDRETAQLLAMHVRSQAEALAGLDRDAIIRAQVMHMDRLAARMASGIDPDLRGATMARREIARLVRGDQVLDALGAGGTLPAAPLARIVEDGEADLPARLVPVRAKEPDAAAGS